MREGIGESGIAADIFAEARIEPNEDSARQAIEAALAGAYDGFVGVGG